MNRKLFILEIPNGDINNRLQLLNIIQIGEPSNVEFDLKITKLNTEPIPIAEDQHFNKRISRFSDNNGLEKIVGSTKNMVFIFVSVIKHFIVVRDSKFYFIKHPKR